MERRLPLDFYLRDTETVARDLLGKKLVHIANGVRLSGLIVETEAYLGVEDAAAHSFGDRRTARTESMYLEGGHAYVYFIYGIHYCFNVVTRAAGIPQAVLVRALEPLEGIEVMRERRNCSKSAAKDITLTSGPGKLCQALGIDRNCDRLSLIKSKELFIEDASAPDSKIIACPRIGVAYAGEAAKWPLRFLLSDYPHISKSPPSQKRIKIRK